MFNSKKGGNQSTASSEASSWLDERIEQQRKGFDRASGTSTMDNEAKERARNSAGQSGTFRAPPAKLYGGSIGDESNQEQPRRSGSNREERSIKTSMQPPKPARASNKLVSDKMRSALNDLEKDVLRTMPNTTTKYGASLKSPTGTSDKLQGLERDVAAKMNAKLSPMGVPIVKRNAPSKQLTQLEADVASKAQARGGTSSATSMTKRLNQRDMADMDAKARARGQLQDSATLKRPPPAQNKSDMDAKARAKVNSDSGTTAQRLNTLEADVAAKAHAKAVRDSSAAPVAMAAMQVHGAPRPNFENLKDLENDVLAAKGSRMMKPATRPGAVSVRNPDSRLHEKMRASQGMTGKRTDDAVRPGAVASPSPDLEERIAYKTGIPLSPGPKYSTPAALAKMASTSKDKLAMNKDISLAADTRYNKEFHFDVDKYDSDDEEAGRLAVAVAVKEYEDEDIYIPSAVEYDPDAKPPMYKNRRFRMYGLLGCILVILLAACAIGILAMQEKNKIAPLQYIPTNAPTCSRCSVGIEEQLELEVGSEKLYDESTSEYLAKEWIIYEDPLQLLPIDANLVQRFLLAAFYFETHKLGEWRSCNRQGEDDGDEGCSFQRITSIYPLTYDGIPGIRWLSSAHECEWAGIQCDELKQARIVDLPGQDIQGTFPAVLTRLPYVQTITLAWNKFSGQLPDSIGSMKHLLNFEVQYNQFTGNIPLTWSNAKNLQLINFAGNLLSGQMPTEVGYLRNLKGIFLYENLLTGTFPDEFAQVSLLTLARFQRNLLSGTISPTFASMPLNEFWIQRNPIKGTIPSELGKISNHMFDLRLFATELEGTIPDEIWGLTSLWRFDLNEANFTGTISTEIGNLGALSVFRINQNNFSGTLPTELESLSSLKTLQFDHNAFDGAVPDGLCDIKAPNGTLEFLQADCLQDLDSGIAMITCECCDSCCRPGEVECEEVLGM